MRIDEGGNVFKDENGQPLTRRINQAEIMPTVQWLEQITGLDFTTEKNPEDGLPARWLGSTGRKPTSGDLDLQVDVNEITKDRLITKLQAWAAQNKVQPEQYIRKSGSAVHFLTAISGNPRNGFAQTDFMFTGKPRWNQFVLQSDPSSAFKGASRNILINSMAKSLGYKLNQNDGIADRATNRIITDDPDRVAPLLLNPRATVKDLYSVERIMAALKNDPRRDEKLADFRDHMQRAGTPLDENIAVYTEYNEVSFMARLRDRIVNQGMQPIFEGVRIEHPEDMVLDAGSRGLSQALSGILTAAKNPQETTVKWDGRPAIIFGRKPNGDFVLTDKGGFLKAGGGGLATSPEQMADILSQRRGGSREELAGLYAQIWPMLARAVPQDFRGYIQGDLLFYPGKPYEIQNNDYVFTPNITTYRVPVDSDLGQKISDSSVGLVVHTALAEPGAPAKPIRAAALQDSPGLLVLDPSLREPRQIKLNAKTVQDVERIIAQYGSAIDRLFSPAELRDRRITDLPQLIKQYINSRVRARDYSNLVTGFGEWVQQKAPAKAPRIFEWATENKQAVAAVFQAFLDISALKNELVRQLDAQAQDVQASIDDEPGHEGYVGQGMKFVDRMRFSAANFARNNPELT